MKFDIIGKRYWWFALSAIIMIPGLISMAVQGFNFGIDFTGGTLIDVKFEQPVTVQQVREVLKDYQLDGSTIQLASDDKTDVSQNVFIRSRVLQDDEQKAVMDDFGQKLGAYELLRTEKVGATIGSELTQQAVLALVVASLLIIGYISYRFEFKFAVSAVGAMLHDVLIVLGLFSLLHREVDSTFVAAILTIVGYSINDTIVIFDRIRENLKTHRKSESFQELVDRSIWQTMTRSIYTVLTVLFATASLFFFGGESTKNFSLALLIGFTSGAYSSIFNASPIWVTWKEISEKHHRNMRTAK